MSNESLIIKDQKFSQLITEDLSLFLKKYTTHTQRVQVSSENGVGISSLHNVVMRTNTLTANNLRGIIALVRLAHNVAIEEEQIAKRAKKFLATCLIPAPAEETVSQ